MRKSESISLLGTLLSCFLVATAQADTRMAASCRTSDVQIAIDGATHGDTVIIPDGSCTWSSGIATTKQMTVQGQSAGGVTITHQAGSGTLLDVTIGNSARTTIANLRFMPGTGTGVYIQLGGAGLPPLMHDMVFNVPNFQLVLQSRTRNGRFRMDAALGICVGISPARAPMVRHTAPRTSPPTRPRRTKFRSRSTSGTTPEQGRQRIASRG